MNELEEKDIERIVDAYTNRVNIDKFAYKAPLSEVKEDNDYNCNIPRYVDTFEEEVPIDLNEVRSKIKDAKEQKQNTLDVVNQMLRELGLEKCNEKPKLRFLSSLMIGSNINSVISSRYHKGYKSQSIKGF